MRRFMMRIAAAVARRVGAGALVTGKMDAPAGSMILGSPAKVVRPLKPEEIEGNRAAMEEYLEAAAQYRKEQEAR